jgi:hypothetical protein
MLLISFSILLTASAMCCSSITHIKSWPEHGCDGMASRAQPTARPNPRTPVKKCGGPKPAPNFERGLDRMNASRMTCLPCLTRFNNVHVHGARDMFADPQLQSPRTDELHAQIKRRLYLTPGNPATITPRGQERGFQIRRSPDDVRQKAACSESASVKSSVGHQRSS